MICFACKYNTIFASDKKNMVIFLSLVAGSILSSGCRAVVRELDMAALRWTGPVRRVSLGEIFGL